MGRKIVIIGGVAAGASAAVKARRTDEEAEIVLLERGPHVSFANCGLPYFISGVIGDREQLLVIPTERLAGRYMLDVRLRHEAIRIDRTAKTVEVRQAEDGRAYRETYDKLIIAAGSRPLLPELPGGKLAGVFTLSTVEDAVAIREYIQNNEVHFGAIIGGGYIGLECAEALVTLGLRVALLERLDQVMPTLSREMTAPIMAQLAGNGVDIHLSAEAEVLLGREHLKGLRLRGGEEIPADLLIIAAGVAPELELARESGLQVDLGIVVDEWMRTSDPEIYAAGDIVLSRNLAGGNPMRVPLAGPANKQGRVAGCNAAGGDLRFAGVVGASVVKVFDLTVGRVGMNKEDARRAGYDPLVSYTHSSHHATYYPGAEVMAIKLIAERLGGKLLGAEIVGGAGVDKRLDVLATAIYAGLCVKDLEQLDLAYAPPYASAKDPVVIAGMVAANIQRGELKAVTPHELIDLTAAGHRMQIIDVRTPREYKSGHLPDAVNIPLDDLRGRAGELDTEQTAILYCGIGYRSYHGTKILAARGFKDVRNLSGGMSTWQWVGKVVAGKGEG